MKDLNWFSIRFCNPFSPFFVKYIQPALVNQCDRLAIEIKLWLFQLSSNNETYKPTIKNDVTRSIKNFIRVDIIKAILTRTFIFVHKVINKPWDGTSCQFTQLFLIIFGLYTDLKIGVDLLPSSRHVILVQKTVIGFIWWSNVRRIFFWIRAS